MPECKREGCDKELLNERAVFCGDACRMAFNRSIKKLPEHDSPEQTDPNTEPERVASLEDYQVNGKDYAVRACAELLNWGGWLSESDLVLARLSGNRVPIPGDWDYEEGS